MSTKNSLRLSGLLIWALCTFTPLGAQDNPQNKTVADTVQQAEPELIPATEITNKLPESAAQLRELQSSVISGEEVAVIKAEIDTFLMNFENFQKEIESADTSRMERRILAADLYQWNQWKVQLTPIKELVNNAVAVLEEQRQDLEELTNVWVLSKETYTDETVPSNVMELVQSFISGSEEAMASLNQKTRTLLSYLEEIAQLEIQVDEQISAINKDLEVVESTMLVKRGPWLIQLLLNKEGDERIIGNISGNVKLNLLPSWNYIVKYKNLLLMLILIFAFLFVLLFLFKRNYIFSESGLNKIQIHRIQFIVNRPFLSSFYLTLVSVFVIMPEPPETFRQVVYLILLIPILFLLPGLLQHKLDRFIVILGVLVFFLDVADLILYPFILDRIIEILIAGFLVFGILSIIRQNLVSEIFEKKSVARFIAIFFYLSIVLLIISIISNVVGYYMLGEFLVESITWSYYSITLFLVGYVILIGLLFVIIHSKPSQNTRVFHKYSDQITQWFFKVAYMGIIVFWFYIVLYIFRIQKESIDLLVSIWNLGFEVGTFNFSLGSVIVFFITLYIAVLLSRVIQTVLEEDVLSRFELSRGLPKTISMMAKYGLITIGILIAFAAAGIELSSLTILIGALGVGIGFGLQDVINNFISGLILLFERPVQIGDAVKVGDLEGIVVRIGIRSSIIQTFDRAEVIVPNGHLISKEVINWTLSNTLRRLEIEVGVAYGSDIENVMNVLKECADSHEQVLKDPAPYVWFKGYGDSSIDFRLLFYYPKFEGGFTVRSEIAKSIDKAFRKHGITIPFPQRDLYIKEHQQKETNPGKKD